MLRSKRATIAVALALLVVAPFAMQGAAAAENVHDGSAAPDSVDETEKVSHTFGYRVENVSNDGNTDELFITFTDNVTSEDLSSFSGNVTDAETGESVSVSSSVSIVDGPDGDGIQDSVRIGVQPEGERATVDLLVNFTGDVTWPAVEQDTDLPVKASVVDSGGSNVTLVTFTTVTVTSSATGTETPTATATSDGSGTPTATATPDGGGTATPTATDSPSATDTPTETATGTATPANSDASNPTETDSAAETDEDGAGFGASVALGSILLSAALLVRRRR